MAKRSNLMGGSLPTKMSAGKKETFKVGFRDESLDGDQEIESDLISDTEEDEE